MTVTAKTLVRVCRSLKQGLTNEYGTPDFYLTTRIENLQDLLGLRHRDATQRVIRELNGSVLSLVYVDGVCYGIGVEKE